MKIEVRNGESKTYDMRDKLKSGCEAGRFYFNPSMGGYWWAMNDDPAIVGRLARFAYNLGLKVEIDGMIYMEAKKTEKITPYYNLKGSVMKRAWQIAKQAVAIYGGSSKQYMSEALKQAHAEARANHKRLEYREHRDKGYIIDRHEEDDRISLHNPELWHQMG